MIESRTIAHFSSHEMSSIRSNFIDGLLFNALYFSLFSLVYRFISPYIFFIPLYHT